MWKEGIDSLLRHEESGDRDFRRYMEIGNDNQVCISGMRRWCKNVEVEPISSGLYAEVTGLPIGSHAVSCPYVSGKTESMNVRWIVSDFLAEHCSGCPHHSPNGDDSWGRDIIEERAAQADREQRLADERKVRIQQLRAELRNQSANLAEQATTEARSILGYLEAVFSECEDERRDASERILQAALLAADALPVEAVHLINALARTPEYSESMVPVCEILGPVRPDVSEDLVETALSNIEKGLNVESSAAVLESVGGFYTYPLDEVYVRNLILSQDHHALAVAFQREASTYPNSISVLVRSYDADPESVTRVVREQLESDIDQLRLSTCGATALIQKERPTIALDVLEALIRSLNLYDVSETIYGPSTKVIPILRAALWQSPVIVDQALGEAFSKARPAVQGDILSVYRPMRRSDDDVNQLHAPDSASVVIDRVLGWVRNEQLPVVVRNEALESLESTFRQFPSQGISKLETLIGYLAITSTQEEPPDGPPMLEIPGRARDQFTDQLDRETDRIRWNNFKRGLAECLSVLGSHDAQNISRAIADCLDQPLDQINHEFKAHCIWILGEVATGYDIRPQVLPYLWGGLMDFGSPSTRAQAIEATIKLFRSGVAPPPNMIEMVLIYLADEYVVVHQAALRAVTQRRYWFDNSRTNELLGPLAAQLSAYKQNPYQIDDICEAILRVAKTDPRWKPVAIRLVETAFPTGEELVDENIAYSLTRFSEPSEAVAVPIARFVATYLSQHERDHHNNFGPSKREQMIGWLRNLPMEYFRQIADDLLNGALQVAKRDTWEGCIIAGVFAHSMEFGQEHDVLKAVLDGIPGEPRREGQRNMVKRLLDAATENASLQADQLEGNLGSQASG